MITAVGVVEVCSIAIGQDGIGHMSFRATRKAYTRNHNAVERRTARDESGIRIDCRSVRWIVIGWIEKGLVPPDSVVRGIDDITNTILENQFWCSTPLILREAVELVTAK
jgi:hypothetical protein